MKPHIHFPFLQTAQKQEQTPKFLIGSLYRSGHLMVLLFSQP